MRTKEKAYAKLNLALKVGKVENGFHLLDSIVVTVDLYDVVTVSKRRDDRIVFRAEGLRDYVYNCTPSQDNAYKAAAAFMEKYSVTGVDLTVRKNIPLSGGMGGSSTDGAAVLRAMAKLYKIDDDLTFLAEKLGSDTAYMLKGGFARLKGRGEVIERLDACVKLHFVVVYPDFGVNTTECFQKFDEIGGSCVSEQEIDSLAEFLTSVKEYCDYELFAQGLKGCKNDLYPAATAIHPELKGVFDEVSGLTPSATFMTGSGSTICAIFPEEALARWAVDRLKRKGYNAEYLHTIKPL